MSYILLIGLFCIGAIVGSFINLARYRIPKKESIISPGSFCDRCKTPLSLYQKIPIISSLFLFKECRICGYKPPEMYGLVEIFCGLLFVLNLISYKFLFTQNIFTDYIFKSFFITFLLLITLIDIDTLKIPNKINLCFYIIGILMILFSTVDLFFNLEVIIYRLFCSILIFLFIEVFSFLYFLVRKKIPIGTGDTKLISVLTIWLGPIGCISSLVASIYFAGGYIFYSFIQKKNIRSKFAFAPFLSLGASLYLMIGPEFTSIIFLNK